MGIYANVTQKREGDLLIVTTETPGLKVIETFKLESREEDLTECFCCSCGDYGSDPACRNHGFAATRPCEEHNMPGSVWDDFYVDGVLDKSSGTMPESVQEVRRQREAARA